MQKINGANREIVYAVRPGISEGEIPSFAVLSALRNATARRFGVDPTSLYSASEIAEECTKEVMDSSFISSAQKQEYCQRLSALVEAVPGAVIEGSLEAGARRVVTAEYRERLISTMGSLLGVLTVTITAMMSLLELVRSKNLGSVFLVKDGRRLEFLVPLIATGATLVTTTALLPLLGEFSKRNRRDRMNDQNEETIKLAGRVKVARSHLEHKPPPTE